MLCRLLMALWLLGCLETQADWHFLDIICDRSDFLMGFSSSVFSSIVFILFPLTFKEHVSLSSRILEEIEILILT